MKKEIKLLMFFIEKKKRKGEERISQMMIIPTRKENDHPWTAESISGMASYSGLEIQIFFSLSRFWDHSYVLLVDIFAN